MGTLAKLSKKYILHEASGESVLVPTGNAPFAGIVRGNKTLGAVLNQLSADTTEAEIVSRLAARFDAPEDLIARDVHQVLENLRRIGALDE